MHDCLCMSTNTTLLWEQRPSSCVRQSANSDQDLSMPLFAHSRLATFKGSVLPVARLGRRKHCPYRLGLLFVSRGKEGEGRETLCLYLVCLLEKLEISMAGLGVKCCLNPLE